MYSILFKAPNCLKPPCLRLNVCPRSRSRVSGNGAGVLGGRGGTGHRAPASAVPGPPRHPGAPTGSGTLGYLPCCQKATVASPPSEQTSSPHTRWSRGRSGAPPAGSGRASVQGPAPRWRLGPRPPAKRPRCPGQAPASRPCSRLPARENGELVSTGGVPACRHRM